MREKINISEEPIRISRDEALSSKVDDFISRQKSLTGESGISRDKKSENWFLQNWFLFGIAGALAAFLVWAVFEPRYDDMYYLQGKIESLDLNDPAPMHWKFGFQEFELRIPAKGWIIIQGQKIWISEWIQEYRDGDVFSLPPEELKVARKIGAYVEYYPFTSGEGVALARYLVLFTPRLMNEQSTLSLAKQSKQNEISDLLLFPCIAGAIGLAIGAIEGLVCLMFRRAILSGLIGLIVGLVGGFITKIPGEIVYGVMSNLVSGQSTEFGLGPFAFLLQVIGRGAAWALIGMALGLGQGVALRSKRLLLYGFLGGVIGGLLGGLLFDPIYFFIQGEGSPSAHWSRMIGFTVIGFSVGVMIGVVQLLARDFWLRMTQGPLAGKEFLFFKDIMTVGASPNNDIYLFNDPHVLDRHATLLTVGDECKIESHSKDKPVILNDRSIRQSKLRHGDRITIGRTSFVFQMKQG
jgi:hypothetical protein